MDPAVLDQLAQLFEQGLMLLQQAGAGASDPNAMDPNAMDPSQGMSGEMPPDPNAMDPNQGMPGEMPPDDQGLPPSGDGPDGTGGSLHDRVSELENHTGLKKSAHSSMAERLDALERHYLGEEYDGDPYLRLAALEKAAGVTEAQNEAPETIPLDVLIKSAIEQGIRQGLEQQNQNLPDLRQQRYSSQRRSTPTTVQTDEQLTKAAQAWGYSDDELDQPVGLGDALLYQYHVIQSGKAIPLDEED